MVVDNRTKLKLKLTGEHRPESCALSDKLAGEEPSTSVPTEDFHCNSAADPVSSTPTSEVKETNILFCPEQTKELPNEKVGRKAERSIPSVDLGPRYDVIEVLGEGASGSVFKVFDRELNLTLAVKLMHRESGQDSSTRKRIEQEADLAITLSHESIVGMYGRGQTTEGIPFIVMDCLEGETLESILESSGRLTEERFINIFTQVVNALAYAHSKGVIHRDIKPGNIMVVKSDSGIETVKLIDFGIAKLTESALRTNHNLTQTGDIFGTPAYMSPEQCLGLQIDARSDLYSLGCVMYEALSGKPPFAGKNAVQIIAQHLASDPPELKGASDSLAMLVMACMQTDPDHRPASAALVSSALQTIATGRTPVSYLSRLRTNLSKLMKSNRRDILSDLRLLYGWCDKIHFVGIFVILNSAAVQVRDETLHHNEQTRVVGYIALFILTCIIYLAARKRRYVQRVSKIVEEDQPAHGLISSHTKGHGIDTVDKVTIETSDRTTNASLEALTSYNSESGATRDCQVWFENRKKNAVPIAMKTSGRTFALRSDNDFRYYPNVLPYFWLCSIGMMSLMPSHSTALADVLVETLIFCIAAFAITHSLVNRNARLTSRLASLASLPTAVMLVLAVFYRFTHHGLFTSLPDPVSNSICTTLVAIPTAFWTVSLIDSLIRWFGRSKS